jgi:hypothetical protein
LKIISCDKWRSLTQAEYISGGELPPSDCRYIYCQLDNIRDFFEKIERTDREVVVISPYSDFGLHYQQEHPIWADLSKGILIQPDKLAAANYQVVSFPPRCIIENCDPNDYYSCKCFSFTHSTFPSIPPNIRRWFCSNVDIDDERVTPIPFGINIESDDNLLSIEPHQHEYNYSTYANWTNYTSERLYLDSWLKTRPDLATVENSKPFLEYLTSLSHHDYCLCPSGNGLDTHRLWESLYLGVVPIVLQNRFFVRLLGDRFPCIYLDNWYNFPYHIEESKQVHNGFVGQFNPQEIPHLDFDWWGDYVWST